MSRLDVEIVGRAGATELRVAAEDWMAVDLDGWRDAVAVVWLVSASSVCASISGWGGTAAATQSTAALINGISGVANVRIC